MAADVGEHMGVTAGVAREDQRRAIMVVRECEIGTGKQRRRGEKVRHAVEYCALFGGVARGIGVERRVEPADAVPKRRLAAGQGIGKGALAGGRTRSASELIHVKIVRVPKRLCKRRLPRAESAASIRANRESI